MGAKIAEMKLQAADALPNKKVKEMSTILSVQTSVVDPDPDSIGSLDPDPDPYLQSGS